jgi:hypothetical protein
LLLLPLRSLAALTIGFCAGGHQGAAASPSSGHAQDATAAHAHEHETQTSAHQEQTPVDERTQCNVCAEHCASTMLSPLFDAARAAVPPGAARIDHRSASPLNFIPPQPERPPLAL